MANFLPRLEWNFIPLIGDVTEGSPVITGIADTQGVNFGMVIDADGFPPGSYITQVGSSSIELNNAATEDVEATEFNCFERFDFVFPSVKQAAPQYLPTEQISESVGGVRQVQINNIIKKVSLEFKFLTPAELDKLEYLFYLSWAIYGKSFRYYESSDGGEEIYELDTFDWKPVREIPKDGNFLYKIALNFRRIYL